MRGRLLPGILAAAWVAWVARGVALEEPVLEPGTTRQLLIDDHVIASRDKLERKLETPERHPANPLLVGDRPWEQWMIEVDGRPVVYAEEAREFRMYYVAPASDSTAPFGIRYKTCLAVSRDGLHWERPDLGQVEWQGSRRNNLLRWGENWMRRPNVIRDPVDPDQERRYKMTYVDVIGGRTAITKGYSRDGITWKLNGDGKPWFRNNHNLNLLGWDPRIREYVLFPRMDGLPTRIGRSTSRDFVTWSEPQLAITPEPADGGKGFLGNAAFLYEGMYLGFIWVFEGRVSAEAELVSSRDGIEWQRVARGEYFFPRGQPGAWDSEMILPNAPVVHGDRIWIYYAGWNLPYSKEAIDRAHQGWFENGARMQRAIGVASLRRDRFVALAAGTETGTLATRPMRYPGGALRVNAAVSGELRVEVVDAAGRPLPGFSAADCAPIRGDELDHAVRWKGKRTLAVPRGRTVGLRFFLTSGSLYAFNFGG